MAGNRMPTVASSRRNEPVFVGPMWSQRNLLLAQTSKADHQSWEPFQHSKKLKFVLRYRRLTFNPLPFPRHPPRKKCIDRVPYFSDFVKFPFSIKLQIPQLFLFLDTLSPFWSKTEQIPTFWLMIFSFLWKLIVTLCYCIEQLSKVIGE